MERAMSATSRFRVNAGSERPYSSAGIHGSPTRFFAIVAIISGQRQPGFSAARRAAVPAPPERSPRRGRTAPKRPPRPRAPALLDILDALIRPLQERYVGRHA